MEVNYTIKAVIFILKRHPVFYGAKVISKGEIAGRLYSAKNPLLLYNRLSILSIK